MKSTLTYFSLLGLSENATQDELESRCRELAGFLDSPGVPRELREWASRQAALVDEAFAAILDPDERVTIDPQPSATGAAAATARPGVPGASARRPQPASASRATIGRRRLSRNPLVLGAIAGVVVVIAVLVGRSGLPGNDDVSTAGAAQENTIAPLDTKRVAELMAIAQQDPENLDVLFELGESFFVASQWQPAIGWFTRLLAIDPKNVHARTDVGTANFNLGRPAEAKAAWLTALELAPNDPQVHYNLGFLYANSEPRDLESARREWQNVVDLAPDSNLAKTAQVHLGSLTTAP